MKCEEICRVTPPMANPAKPPTPHEAKMGQALRDAIEAKNCEEAGRRHPDVVQATKTAIEAIDHALTISRIANDGSPNHVGRRLPRGYWYYHIQNKIIHVWDTYGQDEFESQTGGTWKLVGPA